jgi:hypothetical protein
MSECKRMPPQVVIYSNMKVKIGPQALTKYYRTDKYYCINEWKIEIKNNNLGIWCNKDGSYNITLNVVKGLWVEKLTFDMVWKMIKPYDYIDIGSIDDWYSRFHLTQYDIHAIIGNGKHALVHLIRAKLNENTTIFRQKLKENKSSDCKIDFF